VNETSSVWLVQALELIDHWPVPRAAAAVVGAEGVLGMHGDQTERFALASVTKLLTAYAVLVAVEEGSVALDDPLGPPGSTVRHVLAHASGLAPDEERPLTAVGTRRIYSNAGFELLGRYVSDRTAVPFATYLREAVLDPLGLAATTLDGSAAHGATSTTGDLARFAAELLAPTLVAAATLCEATSVQLPGLTGVLPGYGRQDPNDWGLGFELRDNKAPHWTGHNNSTRTFGHFGRSGTFLWADPVAARACVVVTDRDFGPWAVDAWPVLADAVLLAAASR
jgi:CubicO group peptidase (beta-lactamase class C family)